MSVTLLSWDAPGPYSVAFSTRLGGVSEGTFDSLNLGLLTDDEPAKVEENRRRLCEAAGAEVARLAMNRQVHAATVNRAEAGERGRSRRSPSCMLDGLGCCKASSTRALLRSAGGSQR